MCVMLVFHQPKGFPMFDLDENPFTRERECDACGGVFPVLFVFGGDPTERCDSCHNVARGVDWHSAEDY